MGTAPASKVTVASGSPYLLYVKPPGWGFFANFFLILDGIALADRRGWIPVVDLENHRTHYNEPIPVNGTRNAWEYYFDQPCGVSVRDALACGASTNDGKPTREFFWFPTDVDDPRLVGDMAAYGRSLRTRYVRVKQDIVASVDQLVTRQTGGSLLAVHIRGTDMRRGASAGHPISAPPEIYLHKAVQLVQDMGLAGVYLACDEEEAVSRFRTVFGDHLVVAEAYRVPGSSKSRRVMPFMTASDRPLHRYLLGREVLVDVLAMARCRTLLCGPSNVALAAVLFSESQPDVHGIPPVALARRRVQRRYLNPKRVWRFSKGQVRRVLQRPSPTAK